MLKFDNNLSTNKEVRDAVAQLPNLRRISNVEVVAFGLLDMIEYAKEADAFMVDTVDCNRGTAVLLVREDFALLAIYQQGGTSGWERYNIALPDVRYYKILRRENLGRTPVFGEVTEDFLDDTQFAAMTRTGEGDISEIEAASWYNEDGFLRLSTSGSYSPKLMAEALLAAYKVLKPEADLREGGAVPGRAGV